MCSTLLEQPHTVSHSKTSRKCMQKHVALCWQPAVEKCLLSTSGCKWSLAVPSTYLHQCGGLTWWNQHQPGGSRHQSVRGIAASVPSERQKFQTVYSLGKLAQMNDRTWIVEDHWLRNIVLLEYVYKVFSLWTHSSFWSLLYHVSYEETTWLLICVTMTFQFIFTFRFELLSLDGALIKLSSLVPLVEVPAFQKSFWNSRKANDDVSRIIYLFTLFKAKCSAFESGFNGIDWNVLHTKQTTKSMSMWHVAVNKKQHL